MRKAIYNNCRSVYCIYFEHTDTIIVTLLHKLYSYLIYIHPAQRRTPGIRPCGSPKTSSHTPEKPPPGGIPARRINAPPTS